MMNYSNNKGAKNATELTIILLKAWILLIQKLSLYYRIYITLETNFSQYVFLKHHFFFDKKSIFDSI